MEKRVKVGLAILAFLVVCGLIYWSIGELRGSATKLDVQVIGSTDSASISISDGSVAAGKGFLALNEVIRQGLPNALYSKNGIYMVLLQNNGEL
jgi:hypothetical protein